MTDEMLKALSDTLNAVQASLHTMNSRLDQIEGRLGPKPPELTPDTGRSDLPPGVRYNQGDSYYYRVEDGKSQRVCEDCFEIIPRYRDFPQGLTSPESDGDPFGNGAKYKTVLDGATDYGQPRVSRMACPKAVCLPCYYRAFRRMYPDAEMQILSGELMPTTEKYPEMPVAGRETITMDGQPTIEREYEAADA